MANKAIIAGSGGLIGSKLLDILLNEDWYDEVVILVRKELPLQHKKLTQLVIDFDKLATYSDALNGHALFCCLGTTKKKTPNEADYRKIDHDYPLQLAQLAYKNGVKQYHFVSAVGADAKSSNFYLRTKGQTEDDIIKIGLPVLNIYRPSLLIGNRKEKRFAEKLATTVMKIIDPLLIGGLKKYRSIPAQTVAQAMFKQSTNNVAGVTIHHYDTIK